MGSFSPGAAARMIALDTKEKGNNILISCWNSLTHPDEKPQQCIKIRLNTLLNTSMKEIGNNSENTQYNVLNKISQTSILWIPTELDQIDHGKKVTLLLDMNMKASQDHENWHMNVGHLNLC